MSHRVRFGIVGAGMIANVIAEAIERAEGAELGAVASRRRASAEAFAETHGISTVFEHWRELVASDRIDAVYVATPTAIREEIALAAARHGKHVLADKPFASLTSVERIVNAAREEGVAFMDATHFTHHRRTRELQAELAELVGSVRAVRTNFFFPSMDRSNIRFDPKQEPTGAVGDMAWYSMRAIVEYMPERGKLEWIRTSVERDGATGAVIRGAGVAAFSGGMTSTFDFGYSVAAFLMDLDILGTEGMVRMDDFVLDWASGSAFGKPDSRVGYTVRKGLMIPEQFDFVEVENPLPQAVRMIQDFVALTHAPAGAEAERGARLTLETQRLVDQVWLSSREDQRGHPPPHQN